MSRFAHVFLAALLALAVPIQGLASVAMSACAMAHGQESAKHETGHDHAATQAGGHDGHPGDGASMADAGHEAHSCAACAACCSLAAAPVTTFDLARASPVPSVVIPFLEVRRPSVQPPALERPPSITFLG